MVKRFFMLIFVFALCAGTVVPAMAAAPDWLHEDEIISCLETSVYINGEHIVDRVNVDKDMELSFTLREFMENLGYTVNWNEENQSVERSVPVIKSIEFLDANNTPLPMEAGWNLLQAETKINVIYEGEATRVDFYATPSGTETIYMQKLIGIVDVQKEDRNGTFEWKAPDGFMGHIWALVYNGDVARISDTANAIDERNV